ncbi:MAG: thioredoxin family protein [Thermoguttaceae bacterium]|jgi:peroxiredoxin
MARSRLFRLATAVLVTLMVSGCYAAKLKIGESGPQWSGIPGIDDKQHSLADCKDAKLIVLAFTCNHCPVARAYEGRLVALQKDYQDKGVQVVAVNVNTGEADRLEAMKKRAADAKFNFPYLYDETQKIGKDYGAAVTPHIFVLDAGRKIAYMGAIDDKQAEDQVKNHYLRDALDALLAGKSPPKAVTQQFGCGIQYNK